MEGQSDIFDFFNNINELPFAGATSEKSFDELTISEAAEILNQNLGLNFKCKNLKDEFWSKYYTCKKNGYEISIIFQHYAPGVYDGKRFLGIDISHGHEGMGRSADSIEEAVEIIKTKLAQKIKPEKVIEVDVRGLLDDGYCPLCNICLDDLIDRCPECGNKLDWSRWKKFN